MTYTFKLREGVLFQDGKESPPPTSSTPPRALRQPGDNRTCSPFGDFRDKQHRDPQDDYTVVVNMDAVNAASLATWAEFGIVQSGKYHAEVGEEVYRTASIGTGAFKVKEWRPEYTPNWRPSTTTSAAAPRSTSCGLDAVPEPSVRTDKKSQTGDAHSSVWPLLVEDSLVLAEDPNFPGLRDAGQFHQAFPAEHLAAPVV
ncbi:MAG: ABC transporter substrate-binding protein [Caldilineaceae bacterium]